MSEELKPVAWRYRRSTFEGDGSYGPWAITNNPETAKNMRALAPEFEVQALYADRPAAPVPLTREKILRIAERFDNEDCGIDEHMVQRFARAIEAAHGIVDAAIAAKEPRNG